MTTEAPIKRHSWTKDELAHLNRTVSHSKNKSDAFKKIADEMGLTPQAVQGTYYNHRQKPKAATAQPKAPSFRKSVARTYPIDFTSLSEIELIELSQAINMEVKERMSRLAKLESAFKL